MRMFFVRLATAAWIATLATIFSIMISNIMDGDVIRSVTNAIEFASGILLTIMIFRIFGSKINSYLDSIDRKKPRLNP